MRRPGPTIRSAQRRTGEAHSRSLVSFATPSRKSCVSFAFCSRRSLRSTSDRNREKVLHRVVVFNNEEAHIFPLHFPAALFDVDERMRRESRKNFLGTSHSLLLFALFLERVCAPLFLPLLSCPKKTQNKDT